MGTNIVTPHLMDSASNDNLGSYSMAPNAYGWAQQSAPFVYNGLLYMVLYRTQSGGPDFSINVFQSLDGGATWAILDGTHAPVRGSGHATGGCYYDGQHTITVAWTDGDITVPGTVHLQDFNLATGLWGTAYGTTNSPTVRLVDQIYKRSDGSILALFNRTFAAARVQGLSAAVYSPSSASWGAVFNLDTNISAGNVSDSQAATVMDPATGILHIFTRCTDVATFTTHFWFYQALNSDNSLGHFHQFLTTDMDCVTNGNGNPILVGGNIVFGVMNHAATKATIVVGTPIANPVFTVMADPGIDSTNTLFSINGYIPVLAVSPTTIYALIAIDNNNVGPPDQFQLRLCQCTNLTNPAAGPWTETTIFDTNNGPAWFDFAGQVWNNLSLGVIQGSVKLVVAAGATLDATAIQDTWFFFGGVIPITLNLPIAFRGVKRRPKTAAAEVCDR